MIDVLIGLGLAWLLLRAAERLPERRPLESREPRRTRLRGGK